MSATYVGRSRAATRLVTAERLDSWIDPTHTPTWSRLGLVGSPYQRRRARALRLERAPLLLALLVAAALGFVTIWQTLVAFIWLSVAWIVVFTADEAYRIHRDGATYGHRYYDLVVIDRRTGRNPSWPRSIARAFVLGLFMFTPLLPILALWVKVADEARGPHDLVAGTAVLVHPSVSGRTVTWPMAPTVPQYRF